MSRIYTERHSKQEFINSIKNKINTKSELVFIKKYHNYKPSLDFLPPVLSDIIMSYVNDIFVVKYEIITVPFMLCVLVYCKLRMYNNSVIIDEQYDYSITGYRKLKPYFYSHQYSNNKYSNSYMKRHYGHHNYIIGSKCAYSIPTVTNHKLEKHKIIILKKLFDMIEKIKVSKCHSNFVSH